MLLAKKKRKKKRDLNCVFAQILQVKSWDSDADFENALKAAGLL